MAQGNDRPASADLEAKIAQLKAEHGAVVVIDTRFGRMVFKPPSQTDYERFIDKVVTDKGGKSAAARELCQMCVVYPSLDEVRETFKKLPAIPLVVAPALVDLAGAELEVAVQKT